MDAFDEILARTPTSVKQEVSKNVAIAARIIHILRSQGKTRRDLARLLGKSESEITRWLSGFHNLELKTIYKIEQALGVEVIMVCPMEE
jgi:antitoxin component HigA of HigAB toxin-antitoxin module